MIIQIKDLPIKIKVPDEIEGDFTFLINFNSDIENKETTSKFTAIDRFTLQVDLQNFNNFQNGGNTDLIKIGTLRKKYLYLNYRVFDLASVGKTFLFNFYTGKEATNG